jgi:hypothetical protein
VILICFLFLPLHAGQDKYISIVSDAQKSVFKVSYSPIKKDVQSPCEPFSCVVYNPNAQKLPEYGCNDTCNIMRTLKAVDDVIHLVITAYEYSTNAQGSLYLGKELGTKNIVISVDKNRFSQANNTHQPIVIELVINYQWWNGGISVTSATKGVLVS